MGGLVFDEKVVAQLEAVYASRDVKRRRALVHDALDARPGERIVDVGCGPGFYVSELAERVGPEGSVVGVDSSEQSLAVARHRCSGMGNVSLELGDATALPLEDGAADAALSVQVLEYVADIASAVAELRRVVRPGGRVVVWDVDWSTVSLHTTDPERSARVWAAWDQHLADPVLARTLASRLREGGFEDVRVEGHAFTTAVLEPDAYGGALVGFVAQFVAQLPGFDEAEARAWEAEQRELGERGEFYFSVVQVCFSARRP